MVNANNVLTEVMSIAQSSSVDDLRSRIHSYDSQLRTSRDYPASTAVLYELKQAAAKRIGELESTATCEGWLKI